MGREEEWANFWMIVAMVAIFSAPFVASEYCRKQDEKNKGRER